MMRYSEEYATLLKKHRAEKDANWGPGAAVLVETVKRYMCGLNTDSVLDYGCGLGALVHELQVLGIDARGYDPMVEEYSAEPDRAGLVVCTDVLEHIEPGYLDSVLDHIWDKSRHGALMCISTVPAKSVLPDGRNAHLIVQDHFWWWSRLRQTFAHVIWLAPGDGCFFCIP